MVRAWYLREDGGWDRRETGMTDPPRFVGIEQVCGESGVRYLKVDTDDFENSQTLKDFKKEFNIGNEDIVEVNASLPQEMFEKFYEEHLHKFDEIRLVLEGSGYFDLRDVDNRWVRVEVEKGDLIVLPPGLYHRFTVTTQSYVKALRYFQEPMWTGYKRSDPDTDELPTRLEYMDKMLRAH